MVGEEQREASTSGPGEPPRDAAPVEDAHIYTYSRDIMKAVIRSRMSYALLFLGDEGSGKTEAMKHIIEYVANIHGRQGGGGAQVPPALFTTT